MRNITGIVPDCPSHTTYSTACCPAGTLSACRLLSNTITVINRKGGVGKTHLNWLLASVCKERHQYLLLVDADMQANLTDSFVDEANREPGIEALFDLAQDADAKSLIRHTDFPHIDLVPANTRLARFDLTDRNAWEKTELYLSLVEPVADLRSSYDYIVFDCPSRLSVVSFAALCASDYFVIPLEAADWSAQGIVQVTAAIEEVQRRYNPRLKLLGYLVSRFKRARAYRQSYLKQLRAHFGRLAFDTVVSDPARFEQSVTDRIPITLHAPLSTHKPARTIRHETLGGLVAGVGQQCRITRRRNWTTPATPATATCGDFVGHVSSRNAAKTGFSWGHSEALLAL